MSALNIADQEFHEIVAVGAWFPRLVRWNSTDALSKVEYWSPGDLCPAIALKLVGAISGAMAKRFQTQPEALRVRIRTAPSKLMPSNFDTRAALLYCPLNADERADIDAMRSLAACLLAGLRRPGPGQQTARGPAFLCADEEPTSAEALMGLAVGALLGARIAEDLVAVVPGRPALELKNKFRDAPRGTTAAETLEIRGHLLATKSAGRYRSVSVSGQRIDIGPTAFKQPRVLYGEELRETIARAVSEPWRRLRMSVTRTSVPSSRLQPHLTYTLSALRFEE